MYKLLIVDDEFLMREFIKNNITRLDKNWHVAAEAFNGEEAYELTRYDSFDLIITDIKMPAMDGIELSRRIFEDNPEQKIVILSGYDDFSFAKQAIRYGVYDYLLKPVETKELKSVLNRVAEKIKSEKERLHLKKAMLNLSIDTQKHIAKTFLRAVISDSHVEVKTIYPLVFKLKMSLLESEGVIIMFCIDKEELLINSENTDDTIINCLLSQITSEIVDEKKMGYTFYDKDENIIALITGETHEEVITSCNTLYSKVSNYMLLNAGIHISGSMGYIVSDVMQLRSSYIAACQLMFNRFTFGGNTFFSCELLENSQLLSSRISSSASSILSSIMDKNIAKCSSSVDSFVSLITDYCEYSILRYGIFLIEYISRLNSEYSGKPSDVAMKRLYHLVVNTFDNSLSSEDVKNIYIEITMGYICREESTYNVNDNSIVIKVKKYIYEHYSEPISLALIADKLNVSVSYLSTLFHKSIGESYIKFLTRIRMEEAARLLKEIKDEKVYNISEKVGYISSKHFSNIFRKYYGITPGEYQQLE